jgi:hypothetical protein
MATGWLGWFEDADGWATAFVSINRGIVFVDELL